MSTKLRNVFDSGDKIEVRGSSTEDREVEYGPWILGRIEGFTPDGVLVAMDNGHHHFRGWSELGRLWRKPEPATHPVQPSDGKGEGERNG